MVHPPTVYHVHYAVWAKMHGLGTQAVDDVMALSMLWTLRLTSNNWLRGGSEEYHWNLIQGWVGTPAYNQPSMSTSMRIQ